MDVVNMLRRRVFGSLDCVISVRSQDIVKTNAHCCHKLLFETFTRVGWPSTTRGVLDKKNNKPQVKIKVYVQDKQPINTKVNVVEGMIRIFFQPAKVLVDPGTTHSSVSMYFIKHILIPSLFMHYQLVVSTSIGYREIPEVMYQNSDVFLGMRYYLWT